MAATEVEVVRDWYDWVVLGVGLGSVVAASAAVIVALRSAKDSKRSADAAEESAEVADRAAGAAERTAEAASQEAEQTREVLRIAQEQHAILLADRARKPDYTIELEEFGRPDAASVMIRGVVQNLGDADAFDTLTQLFVPLDVQIQMCDAAGSPIDHPAPSYQPRHEGLQARDEVSSVHSHNWEADIARLREAVFYAVLTFPGPGEYEIEVMIDHSDLDERIVETVSVSVDDPRAAAR